MIAQIISAPALQQKQPNIWYSALGIMTRYTMGEVYLILVTSDQGESLRAKIEREFPCCIAFDHAGEDAGNLDL